MSKRTLVHISDSHLGYSCGPVDPGPALARAVEEIRRLQPTPQAVLFSGDLTDRGRPEDYLHLRQLLAPLNIPLHPIMGNHDHRPALRTAFADHPGVAADPGFEAVCYTCHCGDIRLICLDSAIGGGDGGSLGEAQLSWLQAELDSQPQVPTLLALHHPPILSGYEEFDRIGLDPADRRSLEALVAARPAVYGLLSGHVHRAMAGRLAHAPAIVCPSVFLQAALDLRPHAPLRLVPGGAGLAVHVLQPGQPLLTHFHPLPDRGTPQGRGGRPSPLERVL